MNTPIRISNVDCLSRLSEIHNIDSLWESQAVIIQKEDFIENACYEKAYKNFNYEEQLDIWVYDGDKEKKDVGIKMFKSYPYDTIKFKVGDYIHFDYYKNGILSTWIVMSFDSQNNYDWVGTIRQCNSLLRRIDEFGNIKSFPISFDKDEKYTTNFPANYITVAAGYAICYLQFNYETNKIKPNDRFLFGNPETPICLKVQGNGVNNLIKQNYTDLYEQSLLQLKMDSAFVNYDTDDVENMIADAYANQYSIVIDQGNINQVVGSNIQLTYTLKKNGEIVSYPVVWTSSNTSVCSISEEGVMNCLSIGNCNITVSFANNTNINYSIDVNITQNLENTYEIRYNTNGYDYTNKILVGDKVKYTVDLYENDELTNNVFDFSVFGNVDYSNFLFNPINGNNFEITNIKKSSTPLIINCESGNNIMQIEIELAGAW